MPNPSGGRAPPSRGAPILARTPSLLHLPMTADVSLHPRHRRGALADQGASPVGYEGSRDPSTL